MAADHDWFLDLRADPKGGPVGSLKITDGQGGIYKTSDLQSAIQGRDVLLMAHGYNVNRPHGILALNNFKSGITAPKPMFIGILWPGDCILPIFIDYVWEGGEANKSGDMLAQFVGTSFAGAGSISFASHSLGARVVLRAIAGLPSAMSVNQLMLLAAAVEDDALTNAFAAAVDKVRHISVVHSLKDYVLMLAYPPGNLLGAGINQDTPNVKAALGRLGPRAGRDNIWSTGKLPDAWNYGHLDYLSENVLVGAFPQPVNVDDPDSTNAYPHDYTPALGKGWKPCWSPGFASTRLHKS